MLADAEDPFEFVGSEDDAPVIVKKTPPSIKKAPPSVKTPQLNKKKSPRVVISKNSDEINEMLEIKKAIEESKKTALQEERARRYANRMLQKTASPSTSTSSLENDNGVCSSSKHHQQSPAVPKENEESKAVTRKKQTRLRKETSPSGTKSGPSRNNGKNPSVKQIDIPINIVSSSSRESSVTPTLTETPTNEDSLVTRDTDSSLTPTQTSTKKDSPIMGDVDFLSSGNHLKSPTPTQTPAKKDSPTCSHAGTSLSSGNGLKLPTLAQTPTKKDTSNGNRLKLKRKRLLNISKEPSIKLSRIDTEFVTSVKKPKPDQQKIANGKTEVACDNVSVNSTTTTSGYKSSEVDTSVLTGSWNEKDGGNKKEIPKQSKGKGRETTAKTPKGKGKKSSKDTSKFHLKKCPSLYAPRGTSACDYLPVIVRFFEDFKLQLKMAQNQCVTFVPWSRPLTSSKRDWKADKDDDKSTTNKSSVPALPLTLTLPVNSTVKEQQKETRSKKETVEVDSLWQWDYHGFDSDDQRLFYDSDPNIDPKTSQTDTFDQTPPHPTATVTLNKHIENLSPLNKDISIDISSSNSNVSSVIHPGRRKRKGRRVIGSSDATVTGDKQSSSRQSITSSLPRAPVHHPALSSSSPNITDIDEDPEQSTATNLHSNKGVIDLTELEETAEVDSCESPRLSQEKQVTCPVCQQQFSEAYIAIHAANCELHVDTSENTGRPPPSMSLSSSTSKLRQTTLTHKPLSTTTQRRKVIESDSDAEELTPPVKKRKTRKLLPDNSKKIPLVYANDNDGIDNSDIDVQQKQSLIGTGCSTSATTTTTTAAAAAIAANYNSIFKSVSLVGQAVEEIDSYSSDEEVADPASTTTRNSLIDYKNQFSTNSVRKVSKELLTEDNDAFLLARKKKWLSAKKGRMGKKWKKFKSKGKGKK